MKYILAIIFLIVGLSPAHAGPSTKTMQCVNNSAIMSIKAGIHDLQLRHSRYLIWNAKKSSTDNGSLFIEKEKNYFIISILGNSELQKQLYEDGPTKSIPSSWVLPNDQSSATINLQNGEEVATCTIKDSQYICIKYFSDIQTIKWNFSNTERCDS